MNDSRYKLFTLPLIIKQLYYRLFSLLKLMEKKLDMLHF